MNDKRLPQEVRYDNWLSAELMKFPDENGEATEPLISGNSTEIKPDERNKCTQAPVGKDRDSNDISRSNAVRAGGAEFGTRAASGKANEVNNTAELPQDTALAASCGMNKAEPTPRTDAVMVSLNLPMNDSGFAVDQMYKYACQLEREIVSLKIYAERYRWWRENHRGTWVYVSATGGLEFIPSHAKVKLPSDNPENVDSAIDVARALLGGA